MKKAYLFLLFFILFIGNSFAQFEFTPVKEIEHTAVKDQCNTGTCWSFSTLSFLESEVARIKGEVVDLSEMHIVRNVYVDKAKNYIKKEGNAQFSDGSLSHDVIFVLENFGLVPQGVSSVNDPEYHDHSEVYSILKGMVNQLAKDKTAKKKWLDVYEGILDIYFGEQPDSFVYQNKNYTPKTFAKEMGLSAENYITLTSFTHQPFYSKFILDIPDNYSDGVYYNIPLNELEDIVDNALEKGYTITWDGDVSEAFFSSQQGIAIIPKNEEGYNFEAPTKEKKIQQKIRQKAFTKQETTDDHLMHMVGTAKDQKGNVYYIIKNSWGEKGQHKGYIYMSKAYFRYKTVGVMLHKDMIPEKVLEIK